MAALDVEALDAGYGDFQALYQLSLHVGSGETIAIIGANGAGKTTLLRAVMGQVRVRSGSIRYDGQDITGLAGPELMRYRREVQVVFQDPFSSLSPRMRVGEIIAEPLQIHTDLTRTQQEARVAEVLELVGLRPEVARLFPHEFSGGQRQRIAIARALVTNTRLIVLDEPVSALDVSIRAQIMNQLGELQARLGVSYIFIGHDLATVAHISHRISVMYLGQIVELASSQAIFQRPSHPYTQALLASTPLPDPDSGRTRIILEGSVPSPADPPAGCRFHTRCPYVMNTCRSTAPRPHFIGEGHQAVCHLLE